MRFPYEKGILRKSSCARYLLLMTKDQESAPAPDPQALRALAHPLRWRLLELLDSETTATATRCAELLRESEASCSYHLRMLAKYGYIERCPAEGARTKPWRLASRKQNLLPGSTDPEVRLASEAATEVFLDRETARLKERLHRQRLETETWRQATRIQGVTTWLTADEFKEVFGRMEEIALQHLDRDQRPERRPKDSREVRLFFTASAAPPPPSPEASP